MRANGDVVIATADWDKDATVRGRQKSLYLLGLLAGMLLAAGPQARAGSLLPSVQQVTIGAIGPGGQTSYSFDQNVGPLAFDFAQANDPYVLTTAHYLFNGNLIGNSDSGPISTPLFAQ